jgi:hypothetical protein
VARTRPSTRSGSRSFSVEPRAIIWRIFGVSGGGAGHASAPTVAAKRTATITAAMIETGFCMGRRWRVRTEESGATTLGGA